jgi:hypothetical protein
MVLYYTFHSAGTSERDAGELVSPSLGDYLNFDAVTNQAIEGVGCFRARSVSFFWV